MKIHWLSMSSKCLEAPSLTLARGIVVVLRDEINILGFCQSTFSAHRYNHCLLSCNINAGDVLIPTSEMRQKPQNNLGIRRRRRRVRKSMYLCWSKTTSLKYFSFTKIPKQENPCNYIPVYIFPQIEQQLLLCFFSSTSHFCGSQSDPVITTAVWSKTKKNFSKCPTEGISSPDTVAVTDAISTITS